MRQTCKQTCKRNLLLFASYAAHLWFVIKKLTCKLLFIDMFTKSILKRTCGRLKFQQLAPRLYPPCLLKSTSTAQPSLDRRQETAMNAQRRKRIASVEALLSQARDLLEEIVSEEYEAFENLPDSLQDSERGFRMQDIIDALEQGVGDIESIESLLEETRG